MRSRTSGKLHLFTPKSKIIYSLTSHWWNNTLSCCMTSCLLICRCRKALLLLKKKRYQDQLLDKTENQISNLERMVRFSKTALFYVKSPSHSSWGSMWYIYIIKSILVKNKTSESYTLKLKRFYCSVWLFEFSLVSTVTGVEFLHTTQQTTTSVSCERRLFFILRIYLQLGCCCCLFSSVFFLTC